MAINYDGVYEVRIYYAVTVSSVVLTHRHTVDVRLDAEPTPGDPFDTITVLNHNLSTGALDVAVDAYVSVMRPFFHTSVDFTLAELWKYPAEGYDAQFISVYELGVQGSNATTPTTAQQSTITLRTVFGGVMRCQLMETSQTGNNREAYPFGSTLATNMAAHIMDSVRPWVARDNSRAVVPISSSLGQNERLFRKRFRS